METATSDQVFSIELEHISWLEILDLDERVLSLRLDDFHLLYLYYELSFHWLYHYLRTEVREMESLPC